MERILNWNEYALFEQKYLDKEESKGNKISEEAYKKIRICCFDIMGRFPFFRRLLSDLSLRENRYLDSRTMATDGFSIHYDPDFVLALSSEEVIFVICHEVMHNVLFHFARKENNDSHLWNVAADYALNQLLDDVGTRPNFALYPGCGHHPDDSKFVNLSAEEIYSLLKKSGYTYKKPEKNTPTPDVIIKVGDVIRDTNTNNYGIVRSIDPNTGELDYDIINKNDVKKYL